MDVLERSIERLIPGDQGRPYSRSLPAIILFALLCFLPETTSAFEDDIEKDLQKNLGQSKEITSSIKKKIKQSAPVSSEIGSLKTVADSISITNMLMEERFKAREEKAKSLGSTASNRHNAMVARYREALTAYLALIDKLPADGSGAEALINELSTLLDRMLPKRQRPIIGTLPYKHLNYPAREPNSANEIVPAYKGGNKTVSPEDTKSTPEAPISKEIASLAQSLNWNPVSMYEYVKNTIDTEWYWGCMKGAEEALRQKSGNDCDQATLLTALLRASGYPTRYVRGVVEFFPDIERAKNLTGLNEPAAIAELFRKAGIPHTPVIRGGRIDNIQIEHVWVETQVPYANYRGAVMDEHGKTWLGLDTSIKVKGYTDNNAPDILSSMSLSQIRDEYLGFTTAGTGTVRAETPVEYLRAHITSELSNINSQLTYSDHLRTRALIPEVLNILPGNTQFTLVQTTNEYIEIPADLKHRVTFTAKGLADALFEITVDAERLSNQQISVSYEPESVEDQEIINSWGGLHNTPAYQVRLRPVLKINNDRVAIGKDGHPLGADYDFTLTLSSPYGIQSITNRLITGNLTIIGIVSQRAAALQTVPDQDRKAEDIFYMVANRYIDRWNNAEDELASLLKLAVVRPLPTVVTIGGMVEVTYLLDTPHGYIWKGVYIDADMRAIEIVRPTGNDDNGKRLFMGMSALEGAAQENRIFEDIFQVEAVSTPKLLQLVLTTQQATGIVTVDKTNIGQVLPALSLDDGVREDILNGVNSNLVVRIPRSDITYKAWTGTGYIKEDPETGESGWMLSGSIAGGNTAPTPEEWVDQHLQMLLNNPDAPRFNKDPLSAANIQKIPTTDNQTTTVGKLLEAPDGGPLAVFVSDRKGLPVLGASVSFRVMAGGGKIECLSEKGQSSGFQSEECQAMTDSRGLAKARITVGKKTADNPSYLLYSGDKNYTQVGLNLVTASVKNYGGQVPLPQPFDVYGRPGPPKKIKKVRPSGSPGSEEDVKTLVNTSGGSLVVLVHDDVKKNPDDPNEDGNPVSNVNVMYIVTDVSSRVPKFTVPKSSPTFRNLRFYRREECPVWNPFFEDCEQVSKSTIIQTSSYYGAAVETILGNTMSTRYKVKASVVNNAGVSTEFTLATDDYREDGWYVPATLFITSINPVNAKGMPITAAKAGTPLAAPLTANLVLVEEEPAPILPETNSDGSISWRIMPTGISKSRRVTDGNVIFTRTQGEGTPGSTKNLNDGRYQTVYTTGAEPAVDLVEATGSATVEVPHIAFGACYLDELHTRSMLCGNTISSYEFDPAGQYTTADLPTKKAELRTGQAVLWDGVPVIYKRHLSPGSETTFDKANYKVFGVDLSLDVKPSLVLLNDDGWTTADLDLKYTIRPPEYQALSTIIDFYENSIQAGFLIADTVQNQGLMQLVAGTPFNSDVLHQAQVVLNRGTDMEVRSRTEITGNKNGICDKGEWCEEKANLPLAQLRIRNDNDDLVDEFKFSDGSSANKRYRIDLKTTNNSFLGKCADITGSIRTLTKNGEQASTPGSEFHPASHSLTFNNSPIGCNAAIAGGDKLIISNRGKSDLEDLDTVGSSTAVMYGGLGNGVQIEVQGARKYLPIEPVGVIVLGIDGLRQDVLYSPLEQQVYPSGVLSPHYVHPTELKGLCDVLGGRSDLSLTSSCETKHMDLKHIKLQNVTTIFPSITFAAWASIFTGKTPNETGILGNEFFARDLIRFNSYTKRYQWSEQIPGLGSPLGMITLDADGGAFRPLIHQYPYSWSLLEMAHSLPYIFHNVMPAEFSGFNYDAGSKKKKASGPNRVIQAAPLWNEINELTSKRYEIDPSGNGKCASSQFECRTVSFFNQYSRGNDRYTYTDGVDWWGTPTIRELWTAIKSGIDGAKTMDKAAADEATAFIDNYFSEKTAAEKRKKFPALLSVYLSGLDHYAHVEGLDGYRNYFIESVDQKISDIVKELKDEDEFDNKIFFVVSDHGETQMPVDITYKGKVKKLNPETGDVEYPMKEFYIDTSCALKTNFKDSNDTNQTNLRKKDELNNNNLHIWELATIFQQFEPTEGWRLLVPKDVEQAIVAGLKGEVAAITSDINKANVIAAMNGPMAHIYIKASGGWEEPNSDAVMIGKLADRFVMYFGEAGAALNELEEGQFHRLLNAIDKVLVRENGNYKVFKDVSTDATGTVVGLLPPGSLTELEAAPKYSDAASRIERMNHPTRSGDIVLIMNDDAGDVVEKRYSTAYACKSWHGSLNKPDSYVPLIIAYPGGNKKEIDSVLTSVCVNGSCNENRILSEMIEMVVETQYVIK